MKLSGLLFLVVLALSACSSTSTDSFGASTARQDHITFTKSVPGDGNFVMYALLASNKVHALAYTRGAGGQTVVEENESVLGDADRAVFERLFTSERCTTYRAEDWKGPGTTASSDCPEAERLCGPLAPGQTKAECLCVPPPGSTTALQYEIVFDRVAEHGVITLREPMSAMTSELVTELESMRRVHFGR